ncbi:MAG: RagB/SusD family nutrient uptake outer membrane protein, partial [Bacteroidales bacterium]|nr:RagB/SusD family nutrient uptake outer membrane protein [Bacteroidales bacterium]
MKKLFCILSAALCIAGCSLKEDTSSLSTPGNYFRSYKECQSVVNGCYIPIKSIYVQTFFTVTECQSDICYINYGTLDCRLDVSPARPRFGSTAWTNGYLGVQRCNFAVQGIESSTYISEPQRIELLCETKALRAMYYYVLTCMFGDVPFYFDDVTDFDAMDRIAVLPRMSAVETRATLIEDLQEIAPLAPQTRTSDNAGARVGAALCWHLIGKMALWNAFKDVPANKVKWLDTAIGALGHLEGIYGDLADYDYGYNAMFRNKNTPESIMEIQHAYMRGGVSYVSNLAAYMTPNSGQTNVSRAVYDGVEIPELGVDADLHTSARPTKYFSQGLQPRNGKDIRRLYNEAWDYD